MSLCFYKKLMTYLPLVILMLFVLSPIMAQSNESLSRLDNAKFLETVNQNPKLANRPFWEFLNQRAETLFTEKNYQDSLPVAQKARIIAERLDTNLLIKTARQMVRIASFLRDDRKVSSSFMLYLRSFKKESERIKPQKLELTTDDGFAYYYYARIFSDPLVSDIYIRDAIDRLKTAHSISNSAQGAKADELNILTSIQLGGCFGALNNRVAQILWVENASLRLSKIPTKVADTHFSVNLNEIKFLINFNLLKAYQGISDNAASSYHLNELRKLLPLVSDESQLIYFHMMPSLNEVASFAEKEKAVEDGIKVAQKLKQYSIVAVFYHGKLGLLIQQAKIPELQSYLEFAKTHIKEDDPNFLLASAFVNGYKGNRDLSSEYFKRADDAWKESGSYWKSKASLLSLQMEVARISKDYKSLKELSEKLRELYLNNDTQSNLRYVISNLACANYHLGNIEKAKAINQEVIDMAESARKLSAADVSLAVTQYTHEAYKMQMSLEIFESNYGAAFDMSERLKGRWLRDKISNNPLDARVFIEPNLKAEIYKLSLQLLEEPKSDSLLAKLLALEKKAVSYRAMARDTDQLAWTGKDVLSILERSPIDSQAAVVSYNFTYEDKLLAFVYQKGKPLEAKHLQVNKEEIDTLVKKLPAKIKNFTFYKQEGKQIYDKLLKPLGLEDVKHLVLIPDQSLWKIPFQALSPDGKTYLIENVRVSYAPSVSVLVNQLKEAVPKRRSFQAFSNASYKNLFLKYADIEAQSLARLFGTRAQLNSNVAGFEKLSQSSDIIHFSMHAEADNERAFNSFLAFKPTAGDNGKLTVDKLLKMKLKKGSLAFLASCDTNNVFNGEGLVSLAWGMMGAGATTVISAQWEANDKSTMKFAEAFYKNYKQGNSAAAAMQKAAIEMIRNPDYTMAEPYYWAEFTLSGDFR